MRELVILPAAVQESTAAYQWYENQQAGLGESFLKQVDRCIEFIRKNPESHAIVEREYRRAFVRRFPFAIFYKHSEKHVVIYSVFHCSQDPQRWRTSLP